MRSFVYVKVFLCRSLWLNLPQLGICDPPRHPSQGSARSVHLRARGSSHWPGGLHPRRGNAPPQTVLAGRSGGLVTESTSGNLLTKHIMYKLKPSFWCVLPFSLQIGVGQPSTRWVCWGSAKGRSKEQPRAIKGYPTVHPLSHRNSWIVAVFLQQVAEQELSLKIVEHDTGHQTSSLFPGTKPPRSRCSSSRSGPKRTPQPQFSAGSGHEKRHQTQTNHWCG